MDWRERDGIGPSGSSLNHPAFKRRRWFRHHPALELGLAVLLLIGIPVTVHVTDSTTWGIAFTCVVLAPLLLVRFRAYHRERDRLAAENAERKARLQRLEHGE